jgi:SNF2 family DNA or RNA helicase
MDESRHFLIIVPAVRVSKWEGEIKKWIPNINLTRFLASKHLSTCNRNKSLDEARASTTSIVITTYGICRNCTKDLNRRVFDIFQLISIISYQLEILTLSIELNNPTISYQGQDWIWPYVIMDDAHFVKSPATRTSQAIAKIESTHRLLITEWPIMSSMDDFYGLMDAMCKGWGRQHNDLVFCLASFFLRKLKFVCLY